MYNKFANQNPFFIPAFFVRRNEQVLSVPLGYRMWQKQESKLELAASMVRRAMPQLSQKRNVIILCDSWYVKKGLVSIVDEYENLGLIGNTRSDTVMYDLPSMPTGKKGSPAKRGKRLPLESDFPLSSEKGSTGLCNKQQ